MLFINIAGLFVAIFKIFISKMLYESQKTAAKLI
jgi:hypothetical protein